MEAMSRTRAVALGTALGLIAPALVAAQGFRLSAPLVPGGDVVEFALAPGGRYAVYRADALVDDVFELFGVSLDGGPAVRLNAPLAAGGDVGGDFVHAFRIAPDGSRVVYWADQDEDEVFELFSAPLDGSLPPVRLSGAMVAGGDVRFTPSFMPREVFAPITADSARVLYVADQTQDEVFELFSAPLDGSSPAVRLNGALVSGGDVFQSGPPFGIEAFWPQLARDGSRAVYRADAEVDDLFELFSVPVDGSGPPVKLNAPLGAPGSVIGARITGDSSWVLYVENTDGSGPIELYRVPLEGTPPRARRTDARNRLSLPLQASGNVNAFSADAASTRVVYQANPMGGGTHELFVVPLSGGPSTLLSGPIDGQVFSHRITPDGERVVFHHGNDEAFDWKLFSAPIDGSADRIQISDLSGLGYAFGGYELTPDSSRAVYAYSVPPNMELHSTAIDGSTGPVRLNAAGTTLLAFRLEPIGREVVFLQRPVAAFPQELYAAPVDGSRPARRLSSPLVAGGNVGRDASPYVFDVTTGGRVLYLADQDTDEVFELYLTFLGPPVRRAR